MRRVVALVASSACGCFLTTHFDHFDTSPPEEVVDGGTVTAGTATLTVTPASAKIRPGVPTVVTIGVRRDGSAAPSSITVRLDQPPAGFSAPNVVIDAAATTAQMAVTLGPADVAASVLGKSVSLNVAGSSSDASVRVSSTSIGLEVAGSPGQIDPTRGGTLSFDPQTVEDATLLGLAIHTADFAGTTLVVGERSRLLTLDYDGKPGTADFTPDSGNGTGGATVVAAGETVNLVTTELVSYSPILFEATVRRGALGAVAAGLPMPAGVKCAIDADARRLSCRGSAPSTGPGYTTPLVALDGPAARKAIYNVDNVDISTILHTSAGWALVGTHLPASNQAVGWFVGLVDDAGGAVPGFSFVAQPSSGTGLVDALADASGLLVAGGESLDATVARLDFTGALAPSFGTGGKLHLSGNAVMRLASSSGGVLAAVCDQTGVTRVTRFDATTGAIDKTFGDAGSVTLSGTISPIAVTEAASRILVASLTSTGAQVTVLFP